MTDELNSTFLFGDSAAIDRITDLTRRAAEPVERITDNQGRTVGVVVYDGDGNPTIVDFGDTVDAYADRPRRPAGRRNFGEVEAFIDYVGGLDNGDTRLYREGQTALLAQFDDHTAVDQAGWQTFSAGLRLRLSDRMQEWTRADGGMMGQAAFVEWLDEHIADVVTPDAADLLELIQFLSGTVRTEWQSAYTIRNGAKRIEWGETVTAQGNVRNGGSREVPDTIGISVPLFQHDPTPTALDARLRFRINEGTLTLGFVLVDVDAAIETRMAEVVAQVADGLGIPVWTLAY